ncbi:hypothetical protein KKE47_01910 [Patescibacteria group bacterium]|nr:hypothetical protein [Patescibacteria group bacterium]MCG2702001.1 hypothetical protein [Candidatus Parcubacteria bacterium]MBU4264816.1 hypothetical protein [Patescibacteria group bacterium]MBU4389838.1 hypothetical protein [Patescibacteria group bacterium]MBU4430606.1 hypothetical protein [Patescibacteria group bacterium]
MGGGGVDKRAKYSALYDVVEMVAVGIDGEEKKVNPKLLKKKEIPN